jgi:hypothetical protein
MSPESLWDVYDVQTGLTVKTVETNSQAWREVDKLEGEATSRAQETSDWSWRKNLNA